MGDLFSRIYFRGLRREPSEGWGLYPLGGIFNARRAGERKIFGVRKLGFKTSLLLLKVMRARGGGVLLCWWWGSRFVVHISNAVEFNARMLGEGLYVRKTQC